jgi:hypothetical protein
MAAAAVAIPLLADAVGPAGVVILILAVGWGLALRLPAPVERLRSYHLDDSEVTAFGPGARVQRLPWTSIERVIQGRGALTIKGAGMTLRVPLLPVVQRGAWGAVLARVVPALADDSWLLLEEGDDVRLKPAVDPPLHVLVWWAYAPVVLACVAGAGIGGAALAVVLVLAERAGVVLRARWKTVVVHRAGISLRKRCFVPWSRAQVVRATEGLDVGTAGRFTGHIPVSLPNFWAVAPVIELRAQLDPADGATVFFRVRVADGRLAVVGEVDPSA